MRVLFSVCFGFLLAGPAWGQQIPLGQWRLHPSFTESRLCEQSGDRIFTASQFGFYSVQIQSGEVKRLSTIDGFHGGTITCLQYNAGKQILCIGYADGFIDLLQNNRNITPLTGFYNKLLQGDKSIRHISFSGDDALISTDFGILVVDLVKNEIRDSYTSIGPFGQTIAVLSTTVAGDSIYAGLANGMISARFSPLVNLNDYNMWKQVVSGMAVHQLTTFHDTVVFFSDTTLQVYSAGKASSLAVQGKTDVARLTAANNRLCVFRPGAISLFNYIGSGEINIVNLLAWGTLGADGSLWYTTGIGGGLKKITPSGEISFEPNGPSNNSVFAMSQNGAFLLTSGGGVTNTFGNAYNPAGFYFFTDYPEYRWVSNPASNFNQGLYDYTFVHYNPVTGKYYLATHTNGMLEFNGTNATNKFDENNTPLTRDGSGFIRISGVASDNEGNVWITNFGSSTPLLTMNKAGKWTAIPMNESRVKNLVIDNNGYKWMIVLNGGVMVYDDRGTPANSADDRFAMINTSNGLITNDVLSLRADKDGYIWIGTSQGLNVVTSSFNIFAKPKADRFIIEKDGVAGYLLGEETINDICIDGGNRKWFATNNGVFMAAADGQSVTANFRSENSPLPDNKVYCIGQIGTSGEMFFGTEQGIASYRNDASEADEHFGKIKIYPNPVKPGYSGVVTIEGLARDAEIRITDANGMLVYQTKANGGTATWPCTRLDGSKPSSGVYLVFGINNDGTETAMGRFVFIR